MRLSILLLTAALLVGVCSAVNDDQASSNSETDGFSFSSLLPFFNPAAVYKSFTRALINAVPITRWLFSDEEFTKYDKSDMHDVVLSREIHDAPHSKSGSEEESDNSWTSKISDAARWGRQFFSGTNSLTLGYESSA